MYEAYYSYPVNDGMTITPLIFVKENTGKDFVFKEGGSLTALDDTVGVMVKTSFSF